MTRKELLHSSRLLLAGGVFFLAGAVAHAHPTPNDAQRKATVESSAPGFIPAAPGTYELARIMRAGDGTVLDEDGKDRNLSQFTGGKVTLLSFMYTSCYDAEGCPYAVYVLQQVKSRVEKRPDMAKRVRLVSLSFDPVRDTPFVMQAYGRDLSGPRSDVEWRFLTTRSHRELLPILAGYGQDVDVALDPRTGDVSGVLNHQLKVFLIDANHRVREIYSTAYLLPKVVMNDILTVLREDRAKGGR